jgi:hypothetical protein
MSHIDAALSRHTAHTTGNIAAMQHGASHRRVHERRAIAPCHDSHVVATRCSKRCDAAPPESRQSQMRVRTYRHGRLRPCLVHSFASGSSADTWLHSVTCRRVVCSRRPLQHGTQSRQQRCQRVGVTQRIVLRVAPVTAMPAGPATTTQVRAARYQNFGCVEKWRVAALHL